MSNILQIIGAALVSVAAGMVYLPAGIGVGGACIFLLGLALGK